MLVLIRTSGKELNMDINVIIEVIESLTQLADAIFSNDLIALFLLINQNNKSNSIK